MAINNTGQAIAWKGGRTYLPGEEIPDEVARAMGIPIEEKKEPPQQPQGTSESTEEFTTEETGKTGDTGSTDTGTQGTSTTRKRR